MEFEWDEEPDDDWDADDDEDSDEWVYDCGDPECCMNFAPHFRSECYTPEMYEAMVAEAENETHGPECACEKCEAMWPSSEKHHI